MGDDMSNGNLGVFGWIRESVRRSVLLGFSDAIEQVGTGSDGEELHPQLAAVLRDAGQKALPLRSETTSTKSSSKKRLGRSLEQLRSTPRPADGTA